MKRSLPACFLLALAARVSACATCAGGDNPQIIEASNSVLWTLLGLVFFIFVATGATVYFLWRKSVSAAAPSPSLAQPHLSADAAN